MSENKFEKKRSFLGGLKLKLSLRQADLDTSNNNAEEIRPKLERSGTNQTSTSKRTFSRSVTMKTPTNINPRKTVALNQFGRLDQAGFKQGVNRK